MAARLPPFVPLDGRFGAVTTLLPSHHAARDFVEAAEASPDALRETINAGRGLLLVRGLADVVEEPELLVRLTRLFGAAESYRDEGRSAPAYLSDECHQIAVVSNAPPANRDGKRRQLPSRLLPKPQRSRCTSPGQAGARAHARRHHPNPVPPPTRLAHSKAVQQSCMAGCAC